MINSIYVCSVASTWLTVVLYITREPLLNCLYRLFKGMSFAFLLQWIIGTGFPCTVQFKIMLPPNAAVWLVWWNPTSTGGSGKIKNITLLANVKKHVFHEMCKKKSAWFFSIHTFYKHFNWSINWSNDIFCYASIRSSIRLWNTLNYKIIQMFILANLHCGINYRRRYYDMLYCRLMTYYCIL